MRAFVGYLDTLPWQPSQLDWSRIQPQTSIDISRASRDELTRWAKDSSLGVHSHIAFVVSGRKPSIFTALEVGIRNIDEIFSASGPFGFCFGVDVAGSEVRCAYEHFLQWGPGDTMYAIGR